MKRLLRYAPLMVAMVLFAGCGKVTREYLVKKAQIRLEKDKVKYDPLITVMDTTKDQSTQRHKLGEVVRNDPRSFDRQYPFVRYTNRLKSDAAWLAKRAVCITAYEDLQPADVAVVDNLKQTSTTLNEAGRVLLTHDVLLQETRNLGVIDYVCLCTLACLVCIAL